MDKLEDIMCDSEWMMRCIKWCDNKYKCNEVECVTTDVVYWSWEEYIGETTYVVEFIAETDELSTLGMSVRASIYAHVHVQNMLSQCAIAAEQNYLPSSKSS